MVTEEWEHHGAPFALGPARPLGMSPGQRIADPFDVQPSELRPANQMVTAGRYRLPNRDGTPHKGGWTRATNLASAISDTKALGDWEQRMVLLGVREVLRTVHTVGPLQLPEELRQLLTLDVENLAPGKLRSALLELSGVFKEIAKSNDGALHGDLAHKMVEDHHAGLPGSQQIPPGILEKLPTYVTKLDLHKLEARPGMQERQVMVESLNGIGTLDNIMRDLLAGCGACGGQGSDASQPLGFCPDCLGGGFLPAESDKIADLKTQKRFWTWLEVCAQLAFYAHGDAMWDPVTGRWVDMPVVNQDVGIIAWMPRCTVDGDDFPEPVVEIYEVNLAEGWETMLLAHKVHARRARAKSKRDPWGWLRPVPRVSAIEAYAQRLLGCTTRAEASKVYAMAHEGGLWGPELEAVAAEILPRLS